MRTSSKKGFYIGDICYVLDDEDYYKIWGDKYNWKDGSIVIDDSNMPVLVHGTAYGDGCYYDEQFNKYPVDAGVIGVVPLEYAKKEDGLKLGRVIEAVKAFAYARLEYHDGIFYISVDDHSITINTSDEL